MESLPVVRYIKKRRSGSPSSQEKLPNPFVLLEDFNRIKIRKLSAIGNEKEKENRKVEAKAEVKNRREKTEEKIDRIPSRSTGNGKGKRKQKKKKRKRDAESEPEVEYEIEKIVDHRRDERGRMWYLIKWKGWPEESNTYEPTENLTNGNRSLMNYFEERKMGRGETRSPADEMARIASKTKKMRIWSQLHRGAFSRDEWTTFFDGKFDLKKIFDRNADLNRLKESMRRELNFVVRCLARMEAGDRDGALVARAKDYKLILDLIKSRQKQLRSMSISESEINSIEETHVKIENDLDLDPFPNFRYVSGLVHGSDIFVPFDPPLGCDCSGGCHPGSVCCGKLAGCEFAYSPAGKLRFPRGRKIPIYECNRKCNCSADCPNRVVQRGRRVELAIFKTDLRGWGVKSLQKIEPGTFVCEYLGELIGEKEAITRDATCNFLKTSYLFDLDFNPDRETAMFCVDTMNYGNVSRFINHSCDPNLTVYPVWIDCLDPNLPRLAFFANRRIEKDEEINLDYENVDMESNSPGESKQEDGYGQGEERKTRRAKKGIPMVRCLCKSANCRKWLFGSRVGE